ncbi:hypothetical protein TcasGA2_TC000559 [Tribolium castaneum]|uniref:Uncharacterized protein n=1 Tax=Tribolium castaneum TaxID=7070 RepID=D6W9L6_TRICA|nr:hypothetical protein TcasGA2_TC000559 [Tribolium castaneum]
MTSFCFLKKSGSEIMFTLRGFCIIKPRGNISYPDVGKHRSSIRVSLLEIWFKSEVETQLETSYVRQLWSCRNFILPMTFSMYKIGTT